MVELLALYDDLLCGAGRQYHQPLGFELVLPFQPFTDARNPRVILLHVFLLDTALSHVMGPRQVLWKQHKLISQIIVEFLTEPQIVFIIGQRTTCSPIAVWRMLYELPVKIPDQLMGRGVFQRQLQTACFRDTMDIQPGKQLLTGLITLPAQYAQ